MMVTSRRYDRASCSRIPICVVLTACYMQAAGGNNLASTAAFASAAFVPTPSHPVLAGNDFSIRPYSKASTCRTDAGRLFHQCQSTHQSTTGTTTALDMASPSGIDEWPEIAQASVFFGSYLALGLATYPCTKILEAISKSIGLEKWRANVIDVTLPCILGFLYLLAGSGHFLNADAFRDIYPPKGTWGIWYLPGTAEFHVAWTGVVEAFGGAGLLFGGIKSALSSEEDDDENLAVNLVKPASALALFLLTIVVTPANIYMFTHGATMGDTGPLDISFHYIRFVVQVALLSLLVTLAKDSFFFAWGDELD